MTKYSFVRLKYEYPLLELFFSGNTYTFVNIITKTSKIFIKLFIGISVLDMECTFQKMTSVPVNNYKLSI